MGERETESGKTGSTGGGWSPRRALLWLLEGLGIALFAAGVYGLPGLLLATRRWVEPQTSPAPLPIRAELPDPAPVTVRGPVLAPARARPPATAPDPQAPGRQR